jgi:hypothetical protein
MLDEDWIADAIDDICNPMTDSSPADIERCPPAVSFQHMFTGELTVGTMINNNYASNSGGSSRIQTSNDPRPIVVDQINVDAVVNHSIIDSRPIVVDQINVDAVVNHSIIDSRPVEVDQINVGSSDTVVIDSDFKSFAIDYFRAGEISLLLLLLFTLNK